MAYKHDDFNQEDFATFLADAAQRVKTEEDPLSLTEYRKIFKKNVPFSLRMYVAAYFAKMLFEGRSSRRNRWDNQRDSRFGTRDNRSRDFRGTDRSTESDTRNLRRGSSERNSRRFESSDVHATTRRVVIDEAYATTLFVGIGRNRRVFPRDLIALLIQVSGLERERIGDIRVLDNYSFVQIFSEDAEKVISSLNGYDYRGRKLSVSYSRKRDDSDTSGDSENSFSQRDNVMDAQDAAAFAAAEAAFASAHPDQVIGSHSNFSDDVDDSYKDDESYQDSIDESEQDDSRN